MDSIVEVTAKACEFLEANAGVAPQWLDEFSVYSPAAGSVQARVVVFYDGPAMKRDPAKEEALRQAYIAHRANFPEANLHLLYTEGSGPAGALLETLNEQSDRGAFREVRQTAALFFDNELSTTVSGDRGRSRSKLEPGREWLSEVPEQPIRHIALQPGAAFPGLAELAKRRGAALDSLEEARRLFPQMDLTSEARDLRPRDARLRLVLGPAGMGKTYFFDKLLDRLTKGWSEAKRHHQLSANPVLITDQRKLRASLKNGVGLADALLETRVTSRGRLSEGGLRWLLENGLVTLLLDGVDELLLEDRAFIHIMREWVSGEGSRANIWLFCRDSIFVEDDLRFPGKPVESIALAPWGEEEVGSIAPTVFRHVDFLSVFEFAFAGARMLEEYFADTGPGEEVEAGGRGEDVKASSRSAQPAVSRRSRSPELAEKAARRVLLGSQRDPLFREAIRTPWLAVRLVEQLARRHTGQVLLNEDDAAIQAMESVCLDLVSRERDKTLFRFDGLLSRATRREIERIETAGRLKSLFAAGFLDVRAIALFAQLVRIRMFGPPIFRNQAPTRAAAEIIALQCFFEDLAFEAKRSGERGRAALSQQSFDALFRERFCSDAVSGKLGRTPSGAWPRFCALACAPVKLKDDDVATVHFALSKSPFLSVSDEGGRIAFTTAAMQDFMAGRAVARRIEQAAWRGWSGEWGCLGPISAYEESDGVFVTAILSALTSHSRSRLALHDLAENAIEALERGKLHPAEVRAARSDFLAALELLTSLGDAVDQHLPAVSAPSAPTETRAAE